MPLLPTPHVRPVSRMSIDEYAEHLKALAPEDRYMRFCYPASDDAIDATVGNVRKRMAEGDDEVFGHYSSSGKLLGAAHVAVDDTDEGRVAEVGVSVLPEGRGKGIAKALMERAILHAQNLGCEKLQTMCLVSNAQMSHLARSVGMEVNGSLGDESKTAELPLEKPSMHSVGLETFLNQAGAWDELAERTAEFGKQLVGAMFDRMAYAIPKIPAPPSTEDRT